MNALSRQYPESIRVSMTITEKINNEHYLISQACSRYPRHQLSSAQLLQKDYISQSDLERHVAAPVAMLYCNVRDNLIYLLNDQVSPQEEDMEAHRQIISVMGHDFQFARDSLIKALP